jgi:hypothetical protein
MFSGYYSRQQVFEDLVIKMILGGAKKYQEHPLRIQSANYNSLLNIARNLIEPLKLMMGSQIKMILQVFARVIFDKNTNLRWSQYSNNCQSFCDAIIHQPEFSSLFPQHTQLSSIRESEGPKLDYLLSFRTDEQLGRMIEKSRLSIGPLLTFFKQLHNPVNVLDAQEGPVNQGANGSPSLCARLLGWNCQSEECNLIDHVWTNPAEFISVLQIHLLMDRSHYVQESKGEDDIPTPLDDLQWIQNRVAVLQAIDCFITSAAGLSRTFQQRLLADESLKWAPPPPHCIPQDWPFSVEGDSIRMTQQDPPPVYSIWTRLFGSSNEMPRIELPGFPEPEFKIKILQPT